MCHQYGDLVPSVRQGAAGTVTSAMNTVMSAAATVMGATNTAPMLIDRNSLKQTVFVIAKPLRK